VTEAVAKTLECSADTVRILITEHATDGFYVAGQTMAQRAAARAQEKSMKKIRCALIGSGNIGTDLIYKIQRSPVLEPVWMVGIDPESEGLARARDMGLKTTAEGVDGLLPHVLEDNIQIAFDATSAYVHAENSRKLNELGVMMIDLTRPPSARCACRRSTCGSTPTKWR
jgi:FlaA1/EpsC-like NDP-sugar epimerase